MDQDTMQLSASMIEMIREGDMDEALDDLSTAISLRRQKLTGEKEFRKDQQVRVTGKLRPNYLFGHEFTVTQVNQKTCEVWVPQSPKYRKYSGSKVRIPKTALTPVF